MLNSLCNGSESIKPEILPLFFLLVSFSMQHEETDALAPLTKEAWELVIKTHIDVENKMDEQLKNVWKEHVIRRYYLRNVHFNFSMKLKRILYCFDQDPE